MNKHRAIALAGLVVLLCSAAASAEMQKPVYKRNVMQTIDVPNSSYKTVLGTSEVVPTVSSGRHSHPGVEVTYVQEGAIVLVIDGKPEQTIKAGESYQIPAGTIHEVHNASDATVKMVSTWVVEKDKPMSTPAATK